MLKSERAKFAAAVSGVGLFVAVLAIIPVAILAALFGLIVEWCVETAAFNFTGEVVDVPYLVCALATLVPFTFPACVILLLVSYAMAV